MIGTMFVVSSACVVLANLFQIAKLLKTKQADSFSLGYIFMVETGIILIMVIALVTPNTWVVRAYNIIAVVSFTCLTFLVCYYKRRVSDL